MLLLGAIGKRQGRIGLLGTRLGEASHPGPAQLNVSRTQNKKPAAFPLLWGWRQQAFFGHFFAMYNIQYTDFVCFVVMCAGCGYWTSRNKVFGTDRAGFTGALLKSFALCRDENLYKACAIFIPVLISTTIL